MDMEARELIKRLNSHPMWVELTPETTAIVDDEICELSEAFSRAGLEERQSIQAAVDRAGKFQMSQYSRRKAEEARRTGSPEAIRNGLIPVVIGGGSSRTGTGGFLMAIVLRSAEVAGVNGAELFSNVALLGTSEEQRNDIRMFPSSSPAYRGIERFGAREVQTKDGITYALPMEQLRLSWWDKLRGRRAPTKTERWNVMREIEERHQKK